MALIKLHYYAEGTKYSDFANDDFHTTEIIVNSNSIHKMEKGIVHAYRKNESRPCTYLYLNEYVNRYETKKSYSIAETMDDIMALIDGEK